MNKRSFIAVSALSLMLLTVALADASFNIPTDDELSYLPMIVQEDEEETPTATNTPVPTSTPTVTTTPPPGSTATATPTSTATNTPQPGSTSTPTPTPSPSPTENPLHDAWMNAWMVNEDDTPSVIFSGALVNVQNVYTKTVDGKDYQCIQASGIPDYQTTITQDILDALNGRPNAATDFQPSGTTSASLNDLIDFGESIGYTPNAGCTSGNDGYGYWPFGPKCPADISKDQCFPLDPEPSTETCETRIGSIGTWVNGTSVFNWSDDQSFNDEDVWHNDAFHFEFYDLDICPGHATQDGEYHHHSNPVCLGVQLNDDGTGHSPIYGFAADGYPIYGPWHDNDVLAQSCWKTRDYSESSATGCGVNNRRTCLLVDQYDISQGTVDVGENNGPRVNGNVTSTSGNDFTPVSGFYFEDYYYDSSCTGLAVQNLDQHNGHDHDGLGYHYHVVLEETSPDVYSDVFPYYVGPTYAGEITGESIVSCGDQGGGPPGGGPPGG